MLYYNQGKGNTKGEIKMLKTIGKIAYGIFTTISIVGLLWFGASYIDIIWDNTTTANHHPYNAFIVMFEHCNK